MWLFWVRFLGAVLGVQFFRPLGGQKPIPLKTTPQKPPLHNTFDRFTGQANIWELKVRGTKYSPILPIVKYNRVHQLRTQSTILGGWMNRWMDVKTI